ncbi:MAG: GNAT family N-acetyltransferase [Clostridia bacterium]|nr:GNAT family N-acetyltransferase [Clostridia bacterium]
MCEFITLDGSTVQTEHLCCIIRKKAHPGVDTKRRWLQSRIPEGHVFRKLDDKGCCFIEYAPLEKAWVPVLGDNYLYIYCLWVDGALKGNGYATRLLEDCINQAKAEGKSGICMLGARKQKNWLSNQAFAMKHGFAAVDETDDSYLLLALSFDGTLPRFAPAAKAQHIDDEALTVYYSDQCPFIPMKVAALEEYCRTHDVPLVLHHVDTLEKAKALPCVFNNFGAFYKGKFISVNLLETAALEKLLKKG